jgi:hypothetical protein
VADRDCGARTAQQCCLNGEPPNKGMKQTKPAQAMELRSLSPVLGGPEVSGRDERQSRLAQHLTG